MVTTDTGAKKISNNENWRNIFDAHNDSVDAYDDHIAKLDSGLAYVAVKSGNDWMLPSGKNASSGDYVIVNKVFGHATATLTGGSTAIVENTNWVAESAGALNSLNSNITNRLIRAYVEPTFQSGECQIDISGILSNVGKTDFAHCIAQLDSGDIGSRNHFVVSATRRSAAELKIILSDASFDGQLGITLAIY